MKHIRLYLVVLFAAILPMTVMAQGTEIKDFNSTFTGNEYGIAGETYSVGTLTTSEGNNWTWQEGGEAKSPIINMTEVDGWNCLSVKPKTSQFAMVTDFSVPGNIKEIFCALGGNIGMVILDFGESYFSYNLNIPNDDKIHYYSFSYNDMNLSSTNVNQVVQMVFLPQDESSELPMYIQRVNISTEIAVTGTGDIVSIFGELEGDAHNLISNDTNHNWYFDWPDDGTEIEKYNTMWNDEWCTYIRATGGNSTYPGLTLSPNFTVTGKLQKIIVKAGGDIFSCLYTKENGEDVFSEMSESTIPYYKDFTIDLGEGVEMDNDSFFPFHFVIFVGRNTFLKSITLVMEDGTMEFKGLTSTFSDWEPSDVTESSIMGLMKSKESTPWIAFIHDPAAYVGMTTYTGAPTALPADGGSSYNNECIVVGDYSNQRFVGIELVNNFPIPGHVKKVVVRVAGRLEHLASVCLESSTGEKEQFAEQMVSEKDGFYDVELFYDGVTEYENAEIRIFFDAYEPLFLQSITIVQDEGADSGLPHGKCGDNLEYALTELPYTVWIWDSALGQSVQKPALKLTITGTGEMYDYNDWDNLAPWRGDYREQIGEIEMPDGMTHIGTEAFDACYNAHIVNLPSTLQSIGAYAFYGISYWPSEDLHLPDGLYSVEYSAFRYCGGIRSVYIPASLTHIGDAAFGALAIIENYYVDEANPNFKVDGGALIDSRAGKLLAATLKTVIPSYIEEIGSCAFYNLNIEDIAIPENVRTIGSYAFGYTNITKVVIPGSVKTINYYAFYNCKKLQTVVIGSGITQMGENTFYYSNNITDVFCFANPDALTWASSSYDNKAFMENKETKMHVYAADLAKYEEKFSFLNVTFVGDLEDWEDAIQEVKMDEKTDGQWYDLSGKTVTMPRQKGIYIHNGKKIVVK